jgi:hypothetical protein
MRATEQATRSVDASATGLIGVATVKYEHSPSALTPRRTRRARRIIGGRIPASREIRLDVATEAEAPRLVETAGHHIRFRHPLMRSAMHQAMTVEERQMAHPSGFVKGEARHGSGAEFSIAPLLVASG